MSRGRQPILYLHFLLLVFAGWLNRHEQAVIEYLQAENQSLRELVIRMPKENRSWGYTRIRGALFNAIKAILKERGIEPAPVRRRHTN